MTKLLILNLLFIFSVFCNAQKIEWCYEIETTGSSVPGFFWVDGEGTGYYNFSQEDPEHPGNYDTGSFLITLDNKGKYKGTTKVNDCNQSINLLPFGKEKLISSGNYCEGFYSPKSTRMYNFKGELLLEKENAFPGNYFASVPTEKGFTFFSKPTLRWGYSFISIGTIDSNLNLFYKKIELNQISKKGLGIVANYIPPAQVTDNLWAVPMHYGLISPNGNIRPRDGTIIGIKDSRIHWQYQQGLRYRNIKKLYSYNEKISVLSHSSTGNFSYIELNEKGEKILEIINFLKSGTVRDLVATPDFVVILEKDFITWFDKKGNEVKSLALEEEGFENAYRMQYLQTDSSFICTGLREQKAAIFKVKFSDESQDEPASDIFSQEDENSPNEISFSSIDNNLEENIISATVYPNPTTSFINFEINSKNGIDKSLIVYLYDLNGKIIYQKEHDSNIFQFDVHFLPAGTYIYRIEDNNSRIMIKGKIVKI